MMAETTPVPRATTAAEAFATASALYVDESRQAAPVDVRVWGLVVDPQRALFSNGHLAVAMVALVQCALIFLVMRKCFPGGTVSEVRRKVLEYCLASGMFSAVYAFTGHTWASNLLALWHNHTEVMIIAIALVSPSSWPKINKLSLIYSGGYALFTLVATVKNARRVWTLVGIVWDGMLPLAFALRYFRSGRASVWIPGFFGSVFHLASILVLLTMVDGFAQWFSLLIPPTFVCLAWFVFRWERHQVSQLPGLRGLTVGPPLPSSMGGSTISPKPQHRKAPFGNPSVSWLRGALPEQAFVYLWVGVVVFVGLPMLGVLYGPRLVSTFMSHLAQVLPAGAVATA